MDSMVKQNSVKKNVGIAVCLVCVALVAYANYLVFMEVPNERVMGPVQRIFYFHVGTAIACYCSFGIVLIASLAYLANREWKADVVSEAAGEVGFVFCTIVLITGMIWGNAIWNTWFSWEPRLVTFLLLWLIFLGFNLLRFFGDERKVGLHSAVLGIIGAVTVPIMVYSIKLLPQLHQLHPEVLEKGGLEDSSMKVTFFFTMGAVVFFQFVLVWIRSRLVSFSL